MNVRNLCISIALATPLASLAAEGLVAPAAETVWPQWQARISVQAASVSPLATSGALTGPGDAGGTRALQGGAVLGDYYFASPSFGAFRASGGLITGNVGGTPLASAAAGPRLGLAVQSGSSGLFGNALADAPGTLPYLGVGFTGAPWRNGLSLTADLGLVAEHGAGVGRAIFGNQGMESALRDIRLSPVLQLGMRYRF